MSLNTSVDLSNDPVILHVEDDELIASLLENLLEGKIGETRLVSVSSLEEMREYLKGEHNVIMIILDGNFPKEKK